jgi:hypothetical protein
MIYQPNQKRMHLSKFTDKLSDIAVLQLINVENMKLVKKFFLLEKIKMLLLLQLIICN